MQLTFYKKQPQIGGMQPVEIILLDHEGGNMNNKFADNLKKVRKENNLSQEQLAEKLGVSRQAISKWESSLAYPEMDKIIALCNEFELNIDDLLNSDIKEVRKEEESKKKVNGIIDDILHFFTDTINLFTDMSFKSKLKCIIEECLIGTILFIISLIVSYVLEGLFTNLFNFLPYNASSFIVNLLNSIVVIALIITSIIIMVHIFKVRYLDYYDKAKNNSFETEEKSPEDTENKKENKIIIRDQKHSEYSFINALFKVIIYIIKFFLGWLSLFISFVLIGLFTLFVTSFLLYKTGIFFVGIVISIVSLAVISVIFLVLILNFIFNRKNNNRLAILGFIISLILLGSGIGCAILGSLNFEIDRENSNTTQIISKEYHMSDNLVLFPYSGYHINYIEADNENIIVEYKISKYLSVDDHIYDDTGTIMAWTNCENPIKLIKEMIKEINNKRVIIINDNIEEITIYTNGANIEKLKNNARYNLSKNYNDRIYELEKENADLEDRILELEEELEIFENVR